MNYAASFAHQFLTRLLICETFKLFLTVTFNRTVIFAPVISSLIGEIKPRRRNSTQVDDRTRGKTTAVLQAVSLGEKMDFKPAKQGITNSEVREYVLAATPKKSSSLGTVLSVLAILVPAAGVYAWRSGVFSSFGSSISQSAAMALPSSSSSKSSSSAAFTSGNFRPGMGDPYAAALMVQMNMDVMFEFVGEQIEMSASMMSSEPKRWIGPDQLVAHCKQIARMQIADRGRAYSKDGAAMYNLMGERIYCLLTKRPEKLCDADTKADIVRQYAIYHKVKHGALDALMGTSETKVSAARLNSGVHGAIKQELSKLGTRGYLESSDFGWVFPPADIKEVFADIKNVKSVCSG